MSTGATSDGQSRSQETDHDELVRLSPGERGVDPGEELGDRVVVETMGDDSREEGLLGKREQTEQRKVSKGSRRHQTRLQPDRQSVVLATRPARD